MSSIEQLSLPLSAGLNYREGDVDHIGPMDVLNSYTISRVTRHLAYRDSIVASKLNEVVNLVNKRATAMTALVLPVVRLMPGETIRIGNFRIPSGYSAALSNVCLSSSPIGQGTLTISYSSTYGTTGTTVVQTLSGEKELVGDGTAYSTGEFVFSATNGSYASATLTASVIIKLYES